MLFFPWELSPRLSSADAVRVSLSPFSHLLLQGRSAWLSQRQRDHAEQWTHRLSITQNKLLMTRTVARVETTNPSPSCTRLLILTPSQDLPGWEACSQGTSRDPVIKDPVIKDPVIKKQAGIQCTPGHRSTAGLSLASLGRSYPLGGG